ncbi:MAG: von Willebrand factor type A domain-containing protein [Sediminibacterium sp.]|nr:von Willebrand factor type A domain-containing protein [Sediminibacterium sp.]
MIRLRFIFIFIACLLGAASAQNQLMPISGSICGEVREKGNKDVIPFATVTLTRTDSNKVFTTTSDANGKYCFTNLKAGKYKLHIVYVGYTPKTVSNITIAAYDKKKLNVDLEGNNVQVDEVVITEPAPKVREDALYIKQDVLKKESKYRLNAVSTYNSPVHGGYPATADFNTEEYKNFNDNDFKTVSKDPLSTMSIDVDRASYSNVRRFINQGSLPPADAVRVEEMINYFHYNYPQPKQADPFSITTEYTECAWNKNHKLIHVGIQGKTIAMDNLPPNNLVFLIDVSGSMMDQNKLPLLKSGLQLLIEQMRPQDRISIVVYAGAAGVVLPSTPGSEKEKISMALEQLQAGGSTAGGEGILLAYKTAAENFIKNGNNRIILATDGDFNVGVSSEGELVRLIEKKREEGVFLTVLGFGSGNYKDSKMEQLADKGNGNYAYIDNLLEAKKVLVKEMGGTLLTIAKDVKIQIEFNPAKVKAYRLVGYENRLLNNEDFNDDKKDAGELGSGHTVTAMYEIIPAGSDEAVGDVDPLKYQKTEPVTVANSSNEIMTIKFRYKEPNENKSKLITRVLNEKSSSIENASENCRFASAVAGFGMLLRDSKYKGDITWKQVIAMAKGAKGNDDDGYRAEFIRLAEMVQLMKQKNG